MYFLNNILYILAVFLFENASQANLSAVTSIDDVSPFPDTVIIVPNEYPGVEQLSYLPVIVCIKLLFLYNKMCRYNS